MWQHVAARQTTQYSRPLIARVGWWAHQVVVMPELDAETAKHAKALSPDEIKVRAAHAVVRAEAS